MGASWNGNSYVITATTFEYLERRSKAPRASKELRARETSKRAMADHQSRRHTEPKDSAPAGSRLQTAAVAMFARQFGYRAK